MNQSTTSIAFAPAIASATTVFIGPRSWNATATVSAVPAISARKIAT
jgi:hypothetical protein